MGKVTKERKIVYDYSLWFLTYIPLNSIIIRSVLPYYTQHCSAYECSTTTILYGAMIYHAVHFQYYVKQSVPSSKEGSHFIYEDIPMGYHCFNDERAPHLKSHLYLPIWQLTLQWRSVVNSQLHKRCLGYQQGRLMSNCCIWRPR